MKHEIFMREALKEAVISRDNGNWAVGCIITLDDKIVARGQNFVFSQKNRLLHAEIDAISKLQRDHFDSQGKDLTLYTTLEPCPMCFGAILLAGIRTIVSGTNLDNSGASSSINHIPDFFQQPHFKTTMITGVLAQDCEKMWLGGRPAKAILKRELEINYSTKHNDIQIFTSPIKTAHPKIKARFNTEAQNFALNLKALFYDN